MILLKFTYGVSFWILGVIFILSRTIKRVLLGSFIFILASASVVVASIVGAIEGHTTDIGFLKGGLLGVLAGVITAVQLFGPLLHSDQPLAKVALLRRVVNGKAIMGLVRPFVLKAYQSQIIAFDTSYMGSSDFYDFDQERKGLSKSSIQNIPMFYNHSNHQTKSSCPICLQDWEEGEVGRKLDQCGHTFHMICIDKWLLKQETCPICRDHLS
ncbi:PREDICTED: NEP1-interacting protein-like 1 [Camelina sativa]|uniref:NEP1-interacting protein-like 1 n=1 Tax=Camelina sativa TaxID=90675 RepID=A0ABM0W646_CAMSA|nr:PREDICTED: NEP1-interacting protein-like 1 [Camelina sativa]